MPLCPCIRRFVVNTHGNVGRKSQSDPLTKLRRSFAQDSNDSKNDGGSTKYHLGAFHSDGSSSYVEDMHRLWLKDPKMVHPSWDAYFRNETQSFKEPDISVVKEADVPLMEYVKMSEDRSKKVPEKKPEVKPTRESIQDAIRKAGITVVAPPPPVRPSNASDAGKKPSAEASKGDAKAGGSGGSAGGTGGGSGGDLDTDIQNNIEVQAVIRSYQVRGHFAADLDPLGMMGTEKIEGKPAPEILRQHKLADMEKNYMLPSTTFIGGKEKSLKLKEIINRLEKAYCGHVGVEYMYIQDMDQLDFLRQRLEPIEATKLDKDSKVRVWQRLARAHLFEAFLAKKWSAEKRFGLEGSEVMIPAVLQIIDIASTMGCDKFNLAMPHRGRLNVLANVCEKPLEIMFTQFRGLEAADEEGSGDVKYHMGTLTEVENAFSKKKIQISVEANPSHLESVSSICLGKTRCQQFFRGDKKGESVVAMFIHGDAAFCGQGMVYETFHLSYLPCYTTHGTIHVIINNQVGFTTDPRFSRSSRYCTDVARVVMAPIFHVNGDCPDCAAHVSSIAAEFRQKFHKDVVIDLVTYRRYGHNELDEPMFTQPLMYQRIAKHPHTLKIYSDKLVKEGVLKQEDIDGYTQEYLKKCEAGFEKAKGIEKMKYRDWLDSPWKGFFKKSEFKEMPKTGVKEDILQTIATKFSSEPPDGFAIHKGIKRILKNRGKLMAERVADWSFGEAFAYASLMNEGVHVRLSGQDVERGTFSHRHHILHHQTEDKKIYNMLDNIFPKQAPYLVCNSALSELAVVGFELGYSLVNPQILVMWEAQFGDFSNNAQMIFDQILSAQESKWIRQCGLVLQLPHGMEGMGPEHSSARLERFLSLCHDDVVTKEDYPPEFVLDQHKSINWFVANCTTPASHFHILRRQMKLPFRKPLVLMSPKSLLRNPSVRSSYDDFLEGTEFQRVIPDSGPASKNPDGVKKLLFCAGRTYYDILKMLKDNKLEEQVAVTRTEQLSPFPYDLISAELKKYPKAKVFWAQEESKNMGGWPYMHERITAASNGQRVCEYVGRPISAAPATGNKMQHLAEIEQYTADIIKM